MLPHETDVIVLSLIVIKVFATERIGTITRSLFDMKTIILNIGPYIRLMHVIIILLGTIARICNNGGRMKTIS